MNNRSITDLLSTVRVRVSSIAITTTTTAMVALLAWMGRQMVMTYGTTTLALQTRTTFTSEWPQLQATVLYGGPLGHLPTAELFGGPLGLHPTAETFHGGPLGHLPSGTGHGGPRGLLLAAPAASSATSYFSRATVLMFFDLMSHRYPAEYGSNGTGGWSCTGIRRGLTPMVPRARPSIL